jgi:low temperature requirement protein LtrA
VGQGHRVAPLELFFDLVVVFAFTQVTSYFAQHPTWDGLARGLLLLAMVWWAWSAYAWLTNHLDPEQGSVRLVVLLGMAAMLGVSLSLPGAFGSDGLLFAIAYFIVRGLHLVLLAFAGRGDRDLFGAVMRVVPSATVGPALLVVAALVHGSARVILWCLAVVVSYLGPLLGHMRGWRVSPSHFVERFGSIIIIALGESIVAIGVGARSLALTFQVITASALGITVIACLWWAYFDWVALVAESRLAQATDSARALLARDAYSYIHLPMVAGIVLFAFGLQETLAHPADPLRSAAGCGLAGGVALYLAAHVAFRLRLGGGLGHGRPVAAVVLLGLVPAAWTLSAEAALLLVTLVCVALIAYEFFRHREERAAIRSRRPGEIIQGKES